MEPPEPAPSKWSPRPLPLTCGVCSAPAADVHHYGSVACYSCRAFFRRAVGEQKKYDKCIRGGENCVVDVVTQTNCKKCRLKKCFEIGMRPDKVAQRKNKSRKPKSPKQFSIVSVASASPASTSSSESKETLSIEDIELIASVDQNDTLNDVDICDIAERCVLEELGGDVNVDDVNIDIDTLNLSIDPGAILQITPSLKLTIEEEYKICEIEAAKDLVVNSFHQTLIENVPNFQESISLFLYSISLGVSFDMTTEKILTLMRKCREAILNDLIFGGNINRALNRIEIFSHIPQDSKFELFISTMGRISMCKRALIKANSDKENFYEQKRAVGLPEEVIEKSFEYAVIDREQVPTLKSYGNEILFASPWAKKLSDEEFFSQTLDSLGNIVRDDVKLGTLYMLLILATPGDSASQKIKQSPLIESARYEIRLLLYRYLKHKFPGAPARAEEEFNCLLRLLSQLETCKNIHVHGRIHNPTNEEEIGNVVSYTPM